MALAPALAMISGTLASVTRSRTPRATAEFTIPTSVVTLSCWSSFWAAGTPRVGPAALVGHHQLDGPAAELAALGVQVHPEAVLHVPAERRVHPGLGDQQPHLDRAAVSSLPVLLEARPTGQSGGTITPGISGDKP
jgi:hypothetical protein